MDYRAALAEIKILIKAQRYREALQQTLAMKQTYWNDATLHHLINMLKKRLKKQERVQRDTFLSEGIKTVIRFKKGEKYQEAIQGCRELLEVDAMNAKAIRLLHECKIAFIEEKLKDPLQKKWMAEKKYEKLYLFYQKLRKIFPEHPRLNWMIQETEKRLLQQDREQKKAFAEESLKRLQEFFDQGQYEMVISGAEDLIRFTHEGSREAQKLLEKAKVANWKEIERDTEAYIQQQKPLLKAIYKARTQPMIKI